MVQLQTSTELSQGVHFSQLMSKKQGQRRRPNFRSAATVGLSTAAPHFLPALPAMQGVWTQLGLHFSAWQRRSQASVPLGLLQKKCLIQVGQNTRWG